MNTITQNQLDKMVRRHQDWVLTHGASGERLTLINRDLTGLHLGYSNLKNAVLTGSRLAGTRFYQANLSGADLRDTNCTAANFQHSILYGTLIDNANCSGADFDTSIWIGVHADNANFDNAYLGFTAIRQCRLVAATFRNSMLYAAQLFESDLSRSDFGAADLSFATIAYCFIHNAHFDGIKDERLMLYKNMS